MRAFLVFALVALAPRGAPPPAPCTPLVRGARVVAAHCPPIHSAPSTSEAARLDSPPGGVLTSRAPRPPRARTSGRSRPKQSGISLEHTKNPDFGIMAGALATTTSGG